jgi:quinol monooxygenase YgiN
MVTVGLLIRVEAKPDRVAEVEARMRKVVDIVRAEELAVAWFTVRTGPTSFAIFDVFENEADRDAHLANNFESLRAAGAELFTAEPAVDYADVVAAVLPGN